MPTPSSPAPASAKDHPWPESLADQYAIAEWVVMLSPHDVEEEFVEEYYRGRRAKLTWIELNKLTYQNPDKHESCPDRQADVDSKPIATMPPLLVSHTELEDGYHRLRKLLAEGVTHHWAYVVEDIPEPEISPIRKPSRWDIPIEPSM